jgi:hypothetical protein
MKRHGNAAAVPRHETIASAMSEVGQKPTCAHVQGALIATLDVSQVRDACHVRSVQKMGSRRNQISKIDSAAL